MPRKWPGPWRGCSWKWPHLSQIPPFYRLSFQSVQFSPKYFYMQDDGDKTRKTQKRQSLAVLLYGSTVLENRHKCLIGISNFDNTDTNLATIDFNVDFWRENSNIFTLKIHVAFSPCCKVRHFEGFLPTVVGPLRSIWDLPDVGKYHIWQQQSRTQKSLSPISLCRVGTTWELAYYQRGKIYWTHFG